VLFDSEEACRTRQNPTERQVGGANAFYYPLLDKVVGRDMFREFHFIERANH
jgi:hypothetical protein